MNTETKVDEHVSYMQERYILKAIEIKNNQIYIRKFIFVSNQYYVN